jgi:hypothetical protein
LGKKSWEERGLKRVNTDSLSWNEQVCRAEKEGIIRFMGWTHLMHRSPQFLERTMNRKSFMVSGVALAAILALGAAQAQTVGQDMKDAGHDTAHASKTVGHKTVHGTKVATRKTEHGTDIAAHDTAHGTKVAAHKTADVSKEGYHKTVHGTKKVVHKIDGKPTE